MIPQKKTLFLLSFSRNIYQKLPQAEATLWGKVCKLFVLFHRHRQIHHIINKNPFEPCSTFTKKKEIYRPERCIKMAFYHLLTRYFQLQSIILKNSLPPPLTNDVSFASEHMNSFHFSGWPHQIQSYYYFRGKWIITQNYFSHFINSLWKYSFKLINQNSWVIF